MRPIDKGSVPTDKHGKVKEYTKYQDAKRDLIDRIGDYCAYCNMRLPASLAVEHVQPKKHQSHLELSWDNFLLACVNCNSTKKDKDINDSNLDDYYWPHVHNTHLAFVYFDDGRVEVNPNLTQIQHTKAERTLKLVGLQKYPNTLDAKDRRWIDRKEACQQATRYITLLHEATQKGARSQAIEFIVTTAKDKGFFSIWFKVFEAHDDVKAALIEAFQGTAACFDKINHFHPIPRTPDL